MLETGESDDGLVSQDLDPLNILYHFEIQAIDFLDHPKRADLHPPAGMQLADTIVIDINCDIRGDFIIIIEDDFGNKDVKRFYSRPKNGEPGTIAFILRKPPAGEVRVGIQRDGEIVYATFEGL